MKRPIALDAVLSQPWAIKPEWLKTITDIAQRHGENPEALQARLGRPLGNAHRATVRNGVATIPVTGPIFPRANLLTEMSGATSLDILVQDLTKALDDPAVRGVILEIDSPGGVAFGINEAAAMIAAARDAKRIVAYVGGMGASAAYWLASAADEIVIDQAAMLGSIGVVTAVPVQEAPDRDGFRDIEVVSTNAPNKRPDPRTDTGLATIRAELDALEAVFIETVAANRGVDAERVINDFGAGALKIGIAAVNAGMADRLGSYEQILAELTDRPENPQAAPVTRHQRLEIKMSLKDLTAERLRAERPDLVAAIEKDAAAGAEKEARAAGEKEGYEKGHAEGVAAERARIAGLEENALPGYEALLAEAKADGKSTGADLAQRIVAKQREQGAEHIAAAVAASDAARKLPAPGAGSAVAAPAPDAADSRPVEERCKEQWDKDPDLRAEFRTLDAFVAYKRADEAGHVKQLRNGPAH